MPTKKPTHNDLGFLGQEFQLKLLKCFIEDCTFFEGIQHIVDPNMFTDPIVRRLVGFMKERYADSNTVANYFELGTLVRSKIGDGITVEKAIALLKEIQEDNTQSMDLVEERTEQFFKQQNLIKALNKAKTIIESGDMSRYREIEDAFSEALQDNLQSETAHQLYDNVENVLSDEYRITISTGVSELDDAINGGLAKGEIGIMIAPTNVGKTSMCTGFAASAAICKCDANNGKGWKVLHYFFEDRDESIERKYYGYHLDIDAMTLSYPTIRPFAIQKLNEASEIRQMLRNNVRIKRLKNQENTVGDIRALIKKEISKGFRPDMVIIDYFACMDLEPRGHEKEYTTEDRAIKRLEALCNELNIALWVPIQGNRSTLQTESVHIDQGAGSVGKVFTAATVISLAQTQAMKLKDLININIEKLRGGRLTRSNFTNAKFNNGTCRLDLSVCDAIDLTAIDGTASTPRKYAQRVAEDAKRRGKL